MFHQFLDQRFELMTRPSAVSDERITSFELDSLTGMGVPFSQCSHHTYACIVALTGSD